MVSHLWNVSCVAFGSLARAATIALSMRAPASAPMAWLDERARATKARISAKDAASIP